MKNTLKTMAMLLLLGMFAACSNAQSSSDTGSETATKQKQGNASIVGKWQGVKSAYNGKTSEDFDNLIQATFFEFAKDGKFTLSLGGEFSREGTYTLKGDKLTIVFTEGDVDALTIKTLTKEKLVLDKDHKDGKETIEYKRVK